MFDAKSAGIIGGYLVGNKFGLTYLHLFLVGFFWFFYSEKRSRSNKRWLKIQVLYAFVVSILADCACSTIACVGMALLLLYEEQLFRKLNSIWVFGVTLVASDLILLFNSTIVNLKPVAFVIENVFGKDLGLTGRLKGYLGLIDALKVSPIFGVGQENNYSISVLYTGMADLQNGVADLILSYGVIGLILLILLICLCYFRGAKPETYGLMAIVYVFVLLSSVENTLTYKFTTMLIMMAFCWRDTSEG